jgi:hypothetical protein
MAKTINDLPKREIPLGEIVTQKLQVVNTVVKVEANTPLLRGQVLLSKSGGAAFGVPKDTPPDGEDPLIPASEANGILLEYLEASDTEQNVEAAVLVTGEVVGKNLVGLTDLLKVSLFKNKIIVK